MLKSHPKFRDDVTCLQATVWEKEAKEKWPDEWTRYGWLGRYASGKVTSAETIRRTWQKVLEENPDLRGPNYNHRHNILEPEFKIRLKDLEKVVKPQGMMDL